MFYKLKIVAIISLLTALSDTAFADKDADRIFRENNKAVVVVTSYDDKGNKIIPAVDLFVM